MTLFTLIESWGWGVSGIGEILLHQLLQRAQDSLNKFDLRLNIFNFYIKFEVLRLILFYQIQG